MPKPEYPKLWQHKKTKKRCRASPWWECVDPMLTEKDAPKEPRKFKIGALVQVGWLLENEHGVWLGVGLKAANHFKEVRE